MLCRFLDVLMSSPKDGEFFDYIRLAATTDGTWCPTWQFVEKDGNRYLQVKTSSRQRFAREHAYVTRWYLAVPPRSKEARTSMNSNSLAVTPDIDKAMPVELVPRDYPKA